jgi:hypothetical protein
MVEAGNVETIHRRNPNPGQGGLQSLKAYPLIRDDRIEKAIS